MIPRDPPDDLFGTDPHKLVRREGPDTSRVAAYSIDTTSLERMVFDAIVGFGDRGAISDQIRAKFPRHPYSSITARYKALMEMGYIEDTGERRPGNSKRYQRVMRATAHGISMTTKPKG